MKCPTLPRVPQLELMAGWKYCLSSDNPADLLEGWPLSSSSPPKCGFVDLLGYPTNNNAPSTNLSSPCSGSCHEWSYAKPRSTTWCRPTPYYLCNKIQHTPKLLILHPQICTEPAEPINTTERTVTTLGQEFNGSTPVMYCTGRRSGICPLRIRDALYLWDSFDHESFPRCGGRIHNAPLAEETKFPYLLPQRHPFRALIVYATHTQLCHAGVNSTVIALQQTYWVPMARQYVKTLLYLCTTCRKQYDILPNARPSSTVPPESIVVYSLLSFRGLY